MARMHRDDLVLDMVGTGNTMIDLGCGRDFRLKLKIKGFKSVFGVDIMRLDKKDTVVADLERPLPFKTGCCDAVTSLAVIEHLEDPAFFVSEVRRILTPKGRLVVSCPNTDALFFSLRDLWNKKRRKPGPLSHKHHDFNADKLESILRGGGFKIVQTRGVMPFSDSRKQGVISRFAMEAVLEATKV
jgi:SAM-dependent methyltransferase